MILVPRRDARLASTTRINTTSSFARSLVPFTEDAVEVVHSVQVLRDFVETKTVIRVTSINASMFTTKHSQ